MNENRTPRDGHSETFDDLADQFTQQCRAGENLSIESIANDHPEHADAIRDLFPAIQAMECLGAADDSKNRFQQAQAKFDLNQPASIGDFKILEPIGRGGMGIVYKAVQQSLGRPVAIKILLRTSDDPKQIARFEREAATAAKLHHTNIVPVFGVGHQDGFHYYVMQLIEGVGVDQIVVALKNPSVATPHPQLKSIVAKLRGTNSDQSKTSSETNNPVDTAYFYSVANYARTIAGAISYAHAQGTLHRDIKPGNLLIDTENNIWLADFGLAKAAESQDLSRTGDIVGTMRYMAPEQFAGSPDHRSDVYALGLTIYEMLALQPAYDLSSRTHLVSRSKSSRSGIRQLREVLPEIPRDLATIVMKACELDPVDRYQTASALDSDLDNFLNDRPISARPPSAIEKTIKWCRRNPSVAGLSGLAVALLMIIAGISMAAYARSETALRLERNQRTRLEIEQRRVKQLQAKTEKTLDISLAALDRIFDRLTPDVTSFSESTTVQGADGESLVIRRQPVLSAGTVALLEEMLETYDGLAKIQVDDPRLVAESARASQRVGEIHRELGALDDAETAFRLAIEKFETLEAFQLNLATTTRSLGDILRRQKRDDESRVAFQKSLDILVLMEQKSSGDDAQIHEIKRELARTRYYLSKRQPPSFDNKPPRPTGFFGGFFAPPSRERRRRKSDDQIEQLAFAKETLNSLLSSNPKDIQAKFLLALCFREEANPGNERSRQKAVELLRQLASEDPNVTAFQYELAETLNIGGLRNLRQSEVDDLEECKEILDRLVAQHPNIPRYQRSLFHAYHKSGTSLARRTRNLSPAMATAAVSDLEKAIEIQKRLSQTFPKSLEFKFWLAKASASLGDVLEKTGAAERAIEINRAGIELAELLTNDEDSKIPAMHLLIELQHNLERAYRRTGQDDQAKAAQARAISLHRQLPKPNRRN